MKRNLLNNSWCPLFVVGSGRCGSSFFSSLLNGSEKIYFSYETSFIAKAFPFFGRRQSLTNNDYRILTKMFRITSTDCGWNMSEDEIYQVLVENRPQSFKEVNNVIYNYFLVKNLSDRAEKVRILGLRRPQMVAHMKRLKKVYNRANFVHLVRDGRDVYLSYKKLHKNDPNPFGPKNLVQSVFYWCDIVSRFAEGEGSITVRYENLLGDSKATLRRIEYS